MASPVSYNASHRAEALKRMYADACKSIDSGNKEEGFVGLLHTASAVVDRLQLLGPECLSDAGKTLGAGEAAANYLQILKQAAAKLGDLLENKVSEEYPIASAEPASSTEPAADQEAMEAAIQAVVDAISSNVGPFEAYRNADIDPKEGDDCNSPTTATQPVDNLPKFELVVTKDETSSLDETDSLLVVDQLAELAMVESKVAPIDNAELEIQPPARGVSLQAGSSLTIKPLKNHLEVDTEAAKKQLDRRTSKEKLADAVAEALEQLSEARSPADDWVLAGSPSVSRPSLMNSRQASSSTIIRKPKLLPQVSDVNMSPKAEVEEAIEGGIEIQAEEADSHMISLEATVSMEDLDRSVVRSESSPEEEPTTVDSEHAPGPWSEIGSISSLAGSTLPEILEKDTNFVIPTRGQSLRNPIQQTATASAAAHALVEAVPPQRKDSLRTQNGAQGTMNMRRNTSMDRSQSRLSMVFGPNGPISPEKLPTNIVEAQSVNSKIWKEMVHEYRERNEPIPADVAVSVMQSMVQNYAAARDHWDRSKSHRSQPMDPNLPPLPRKLSSKASPGNFKSPGADSGVTDLNNVSPRSIESATTAVSSSRSPAYELTPASGDPARDEQRLKKQAACQMIVREIYETELGFKDSMRILTEALGQRMREASAGKDPMISRRDVEVIFKFTPDLVRFSDVLCQEFKVAVEKYPQDPSVIGNVFANHAGDFEIFIHFVTNYSRAKATIRRYEDISPAFKKFLQERQDSPECKKQDIHSYLINPIQRAMRYYLLLSTLLKKMDPNSESFTLIESACMFMNEISQAMNRMQQQEEEINGLFEMHRLVEFCPDTILSSSRRFEKAFMCEDIKKQRHIKAFVLSDLIIFSRIKKESKDDYDVNASSAKDKEALAKGKRRYTLKEMCFVIDVRLAEPQDGDDGTILRLQLVNPFRVGNDGKPKNSVRRTSTRSKRGTLTSTNSQSSRGRWSFGRNSMVITEAERDSSEDELDQQSETSTRQSSPARKGNSGSIRGRNENFRASMVIDDASSIMQMEDEDAHIMDFVLKFPDCLARDDMVRLVSDLQMDAIQSAENPSDYY